MDLVFKAMADPTRRALLDALFVADGQSLSALESRFDMCRIAVAKHLRILEGAGLVVTKRHGREKLHFLNPVPIQQVQRPLGQQIHPGELRGNWARQLRLLRGS